MEYLNTVAIVIACIVALLFVFILFFPELMNLLPRTKHPLPPVSTDDSCPL